MISSRDATFRFSMTWEGGADLSLDQMDNGNWTGGRRGFGSLVGSKYGVTAVSLAMWRASGGVPATITPADMANLGEAEAEAIFVTQTWQALSGDQLPPGVDLMTVDFGYNAGNREAGWALQRTVGMSAAAADGWIGAKTIGAITPAVASLSLDAKPSDKATTILQKALGFAGDDIDGDYGPMTLAAMQNQPQGRLWLFCAHLADQRVAAYESFVQYPTYGEGWVNRAWASLPVALQLISPNLLA